MSKTIFLKFTRKSEITSNLGYLDWRLHFSHFDGWSDKKQNLDYSLVSLHLGFTCLLVSFTDTDKNHEKLQGNISINFPCRNSNAVWDI